MTITALLGQTVTVTPVTSGSADDMGNPVDVLGAPVTYNARIQQTQAQEIIVGRDTAISDWVIYLPVDAVIGHRDLVTYEARTYEVTGEPYKVWTPTGAHHVKARMRLVEG